MMVDAKPDKEIEKRERIVKRVAPGELRDGFYVNRG